MRGQLRHRHYSLSPAHPQLLPRAALESTTVSGLSAKTVPSGLEESATASEGGLPKATAAHGSRGSARCGKSRSEEHTSELQSRENLVCRLLLEKKKTIK